MADDQSPSDKPSEKKLEELEKEIEKARREGKEAEQGSFYEGESPMYPDDSDKDGKAD